MENDKKFAYLCPIRFGLAGGIYLAAAVFICTLFGYFTGHGKEWFSVVKSMWPGYDVTIVGAFIGAIYGFIKGFLTLLVIGWLYNLMLCCKCCKREESSSCKTDKL